MEENIDFSPSLDQTKSDTRTASDKTKSLSKKQIFSFSESFNLKDIKDFEELFKIVDTRSTEERLKIEESEEDDFNFDNETSNKQLLLFELDSDIFSQKDIKIDKKGLSEGGCYQGITVFRGFSKNECKLINVQLNIASESLLFTVKYDFKEDSFVFDQLSVDPFPKPLFQRKVKESEYVSSPVFLKFDLLVVKLVKQDGFLKINVYDGEKKTHE